MTREEILKKIEQAKTSKGGFSKKSFIKLGLEWPPKKGWQKELLKQATDVPKGWEEEELEARKSLYKNRKAINATMFGTPSDWSRPAYNKPLISPSKD